MFKDFGSCEMLPFPPLLPHLLSLLPSLAFKNQTRPELYNLKINNEKKKRATTKITFQGWKGLAFSCPLLWGNCVCVLAVVWTGRGERRLHLGQNSHPGRSDNVARLGKMLRSCKLLYAVKI